MRVSVEKPGTPAELVHFGVKGMKWGVRNEARRGLIKVAQKQSSGLVDAQKKVYGKQFEVERKVIKKVHDLNTPENRAKVKKVAATVAVVGAGAVAVAVILNTKGKVPVKSVSKYDPAMGEAAQRAFQAAVKPELFKTTVTSVPKVPSPSYASMKKLQETLKPHEYILWDNVAEAYKVSTTQGYNPITKKVLS